MHEQKCPVCGARSWSWLYKHAMTREIVGCDMCCIALDEEDASCEEGMRGKSI